MNDKNRRDEDQPQGLPDVPRIRLRAGSGIVIDFTLPLHESIHHQWRGGELQRVDDDGNPWEGDEYDLSALEGGGSGAAEGDAPDDDGPEPVRPSDTAPKKAWQEYAVALGAVSDEEAAGMTRADLIKVSTPPELDPTLAEA